MRRFALGILVALCLAAFAAPVRAAAAFGAIESPSDGSTVFGVFAVRGWVLDMNAIQSIQVFVDGQCANQVNGVCHNVAQMNIPRPDVIAAEPAFANSPTANPGFLLYLAPGTGDGQLSSGNHTITVVATEVGDPNDPVTIGSVSVNVDSGTDQAPFGGINQPPASPNLIEGANSAFLVQGWALDDHGMDHVDVLVDGTVVASTNRFGPRPDVQAAFPTVPNSLFSGWSVHIDSTALINGMHTISAQAWEMSVNGASPKSTIIGVRTVQVDNASLNLHPFGAIEYPVDESTIPRVACSPATNNTCVTPPVSPPVACETSTCAVTINPANLNPVTGWVLDTGARSDLGQTAYVQLLIDGVVIADTRQDCVLLGAAFANCYGVNRPDIERQYPGFVNSDNAGYIFDYAVVDDGTGQLGIFLPVQSLANPATTGVCLREVTVIVPGKHDISVRAGDVAETVADIGTPISVDFTTGCQGVTSIDQPAFGNIETPGDFQFLSGTVAVSGWAFDPDGYSCSPSNSLSHIDVDIDGHYMNIVTKQPCGNPCPPFTNCPIVDPDCQPEPPGSNDHNNGVEWCLVRADVPVHDVRVPISFTSPDPPCSPDSAAWIAGLAEVGWSFHLDTTQLSNTDHDMNVYASDCKGNRILIGRRHIVVFNDPQRGVLTIPGQVAAPVTRDPH